MTATSTVTRLPLELTKDALDDRYESIQKQASVKNTAIYTVKLFLLTFGGVNAESVSAQT